MSFGFWEFQHSQHLCYPPHLFWSNSKENLWSPSKECCQKHCFHCRRPLNFAMMVFGYFAIFADCYRMHTLLLEFAEKWVRFGVIILFEKSVVPENKFSKKTRTKKSRFQFESSRNYWNKIENMKKSQFLTKLTHKFANLECSKCIPGDGYIRRNFCFSGIFGNIHYNSLLRYMRHLGLCGMSNLHINFELKFNFQK